MKDDSRGQPLFGVDDEMAFVMAAHDWSTSPVGPPEQWPPLLQTMVRIVMTSRFSMWMGWGPELSFFYNRAYATDTLGVKHPWALGRPAREVWSEIWEDIGPRLDTVMSSGQATWDQALLLFLERSGYREETYHTFSYSPVSDVDGSIVAMLCVVNEDTKRVIAERRMATLRDLSVALSGARTEAEVWSAVTEQLATNDRDLPFAMTYLDAGGPARLVASTGLDPGHPLAPLTIEAGSAATWPLPSGSDAVVDLPPAVPDHRVPTGAWTEPPHQAVVVPLVDPNQGAPTGWFVAGVNPYRAFDSDYRSFCDLLASAIGSAVGSARAYEAERERAESLAQLDQAKTEFFSNVSHEFRTPLTLIMAPADDALSDDLDPLPAPQRARLEVIQRNARRLKRLVNDMLDFARIEGGRLRAETVPTDLAAYTGELARSFAPAFERSGLEFRIGLEPLPRPVNVDRDMWEKIVLNLLSNAFKFTLSGHVELSLRSGPGDEAVLTVSDTGVGIPSEHQEHLFERFYRAPRSAARSHEGTGIGLALVAELARLHGGHVAMHSVESEGSSFSVTIPFGSASATPAASSRESSVAAYLDEALQWVDGDYGSATSVTSRRTVTGTTGQSSVLVVDDNPDMRAYLLRLLEPYWQVLVASDGLEALELARRRSPDLVLTDVMMPGLDGFGLLSALRSDPATATTPVVFLSARAGEDAAVEGLGAGVDDYLVKPFSGLELLARVRSNLELAALRNREAAWRSALVDSLQDAVVVIDAAGKVVEANSAFEKITGYPRSRLPYSPPYPWMDPTADSAEGTSIEELEASIRAGRRTNATITIRHRLGHQMHLAVTASTIGDGDDQRAVVAFHDVTSEMATADRDGALARLGIRLAEASDVAEVHEAGLSELRRAFGARRASVVVCREGRVEEECFAGEGGPLEGPVAEEIMERIGRETTVSLPTQVEDPRVVTGIGATLDPRGGQTAVWIEFASPRAVRPEERALFAVLCGYFGQAIRRAQLFDDNRAVASAMQRSILGPTDVPPSIAVRYFPAVRPLEVGGDWYDVVQLDAHRMAVVVGDCTGRGLEAATTMGQLRSACRALLLRATGPADVIASLDTFAERLPGALCTTVFCGLIDDRDQSLTYSSAGHLPGLLADTKGASVFLDQGQGVPLGYQFSLERPQATVGLEPAATLFLYTDGLVERRRESLDVGLGRLQESLRECAGQSPDETADGVLGQLVPSGGHEDDIAVLVYRHPGAAVDRTSLNLRIAARAGLLGDVRRQMRSWLEANSISRNDANDVLIATGEALANAIEHGYGFDGIGMIELTITTEEGALKIDVTDRGGWSETASEANRGRGLAIMAALTDAVDVDRSPQGTRVSMQKRIGK